MQNDINYNICWSQNEEHPYENSLYSDVSSIGIHLEHGTKCDFTLEYRAEGKNYRITDGCTGEGHNVRCF